MNPLVYRSAAANGENAPGDERQDGGRHEAERGAIPEKAWTICEADDAASGGQHHSHERVIDADERQLSAAERRVPTGEPGIGQLEETGRGGAITDS
jgi:hypothetical protein